MKKLIFIIIFALLFIFGGGLYLGWRTSFEEKAEEPVFCTQDAKLCSDGSYVGRVGPNCEFAACPGEKTGAGTTAVITGKVSVGPICPVERVDMPCKTPPEAYTSREIILYAEDGQTVVKRMYFNPDGTYRFEVPAGIYVLGVPRQGIGGSKELPRTVSIKADETIEVNFSIDTGIR